jgi:hypothetical protein
VTAWQWLIVVGGACLSGVFAWKWFEWMERP